MAEIEYKTPEDVREDKMRAKADRIYTKSLRNTEEAPAKDPRDAVRGQRGYAKGGSASSRADGCCTKGKTRGKIV
jgi:hypothetical protein